MKIKLAFEKKAYNPRKHFPKYSTFSNSSLETYEQNYSGVALKQSCNKPPVKRPSTIYVPNKL